MSRASVVLSPCVLYHCLVFINPGLEQPASLTNVYRLGDNFYKGSGRQHCFSAYVEWGLSLSPKWLECGVGPEEYSDIDR